MTTWNSFEEIESWRHARKMTKAIYTINSHGPIARDFALHDQMRKCCVSIMPNIAEGFEREGNREFSLIHLQCKKI